jgi:diguanylate cyclase (GGDEF)-like protein/PAS domain S-box-containing protein
MPQATIPDNESERLASLYQLLVLDTAPEPVFDTIVRLAAQVCDVPVALVSLVDADRQWFKAQVGLEGVGQTPREQAFCAHAILNDKPLTVSDATQDQRFSDNPLVTNGPAIRFYAGAPLVIDQGERVGTLCVIDQQPRTMTAKQVETLQLLADLVSQTLMMRRDLLCKSLAVRSQYEDSLRDSAARYEALVEEQHEMISLAKADGTLLFVNRAYALNYGRQREELLGRSFFDFVPETDREAVRAIVQEVLTTGEVRHSESLIRTPGGRELWVAWTNSAKLDEQGELRLHSSGRDITESKLAQAALKESERLLERTGRLAKVGGWRYDLIAGNLFWSDQIRRIHGVGADFEPTLAKALSFCLPDYRDRVSTVVSQAMVDGEPWTLEFPIMDATGRLVWVLTQGESERVDGQIIALFGAFQDVTERHLLEERIEEGARFVRLITDNLPQRVAYFDHERRIRFANQAFCDQNGRTREAILGRTRNELQLTPLSPEVMARVDQVLKGHRQQFEVDEFVQGQLRRFDVRLLPDRNADGSVKGYFATGIDITERAAAENALRVLTTIFDKTTDFVVQTDRFGKITYMNPAVRRLTGLALDAPVDHLRFSDFNTASTNRLYEEVIVPALRKDGVWLGLTTVYGANQRVIPVSHMVLAHLDSEGRIARYSAVMRDISAMVEAQQELMHQAATLRSVTEAIPAAVAVLSIDQGITFANSAFERWVGAPRGAIVGQVLAQILADKAYQAIQPWLLRALHGETVIFDWPADVSVHPGHWTVTCIPLSTDIGQPNGCVLIAQDTTDQKQESQRLLELTQRDPLTGLLNRTGLRAYMDDRLTHHPDATVAMLYCDLDYFKPVNDQYGHPVGDQLLQIFSQRLSRLVRPMDAIARLGGDEFVIVVADAENPRLGRKVAKKVIEAASTPFHIGELHIQVGVSVGIAVGQPAEVDWQLLLTLADTRLYEAKQAGRGRAAGDDTQSAPLQ